MLNRNVNSHFATNPTSIDMSRSSFDRDSSVKTSFNVGSVIPFYLDEVLPGDTFSIDTSKVVRLQTLITPMMDNLYLDTYWFFVPNRLVWSHWKEFMGENTQSAWIPETEYNVPVITAPPGGWNVGTIADFMGIPTGVSNISVNALPFRAYALIMNEWFRDQNLSDPLNIPVDEATVTGVNTGNYVTDVAKGGMPFKAAKFFDYFTSCLPSPQKGPDVTIQLAQGDFTATANAGARFDQFATTPSGSAVGRLLVSLPNSGTTGIDVQRTGGSAADNVSTYIPLAAMPDYTVGLPDLSIVTINQLRQAR